MSESLITDKEGISVITPTIRKECISQILTNYQRQRLNNKELIIIINNDRMSAEEFNVNEEVYPDIKIYQLPENKTLGDCLNMGVEKAKYNYIAKFDDDDFYSMNYLEEAYNAFKKEACDIVCKHSIFYYLEEYEELIIFSLAKQNQEALRGAGATICARKSIFEKIQFGQFERGTDTNFFMKCRKNGLAIYSTTAYNFLCVRHEDISKHTWQISAEELRHASKPSWFQKMTLEEAQMFISRIY